MPLAQVLDALQQVHSLQSFFDGGILHTQAVGGGSIHHAAKVTTAQGFIFVKYNHAREFDNFQAEAAGLGYLARAGYEPIPKVLAMGQEGNDAWLAMEYLPPARGNVHSDVHFGAKIAYLHVHSAENFGLDTDNFIGRLPQINRWCADWPTFFAECRLAPQLTLARLQGLLTKDDEASFDRLISRLPKLMPPGRPSLLHGDLWSGNYLPTREADGTVSVALIDPAVYFGHREAEIAFTRLFGGFSQAFYDAYHDTLPLEPGWQTRVDLFNIYPLLVHLNLFGLSYKGELMAAVKRYI